MLRELCVRNLAVIKDIDVRFDSMDEAIVGETGAGKSVLISALSLLLGQKLDSSLLRDDMEKSEISGLFQLSPDFINRHQDVSDHIDDDGMLLLRREILPDHTSRYHMNGHLISLSEYKEVTRHLIDIHSQGTNSDLLDEKKQLFYLDSFGGDELAEVKADFEVAHARLLQSQKELSRSEMDQREYDRDYLEFQIKEIKRYDLKPDEIEELNAEYDKLRSAEKLQSRFEEFMSLSETEKGSLKDILAMMRSKLVGFADTELDGQSRKLIEDMNALESDLAEFESAYDDLDIDPDRIDQINERLFQLKDLQRRYGKTTSEILDKLTHYEDMLADIDRFETKKFNLERKIEAERREAEEKAELLSQERKKTATALSQKINEELSDLGLRTDGFSIVFERTPLSDSGIDKVVFMVQLNKGIGASPLSKAASGGETSRLMLALKSVLNVLDPYDVLVFDEIDTGVSGRVASLVASKMRKLSSTSQMIIISHLPQVVASCDEIFKLEKGGEEITETQIKRVEGEEIYQEIARLISGKEVTSSALSQAHNLRSEYFDE